MSRMPGLFDGLSNDVLSANLQNAQLALISLQSGAQVASASYTQGDGAKSVSYRQTDIAKLTMLIRMLQQALGIIDVARSALRPRF
ncbi:MAG TPA: gpW family head-tail joining protein [Sphingobium sp.]|uniref:gpW family head-tail joining protein n=1 Tax=Sphingobium sp. TaxID=1912891 RepID=UPI002ED33EEC